MENAKEPIGDYLRRGNLSLHVAPGLSRAEYDEKRRETFLTAVTTWNQLDKGNRLKIRLPATLDTEVVNIPTQQEIFTAIDLDSDDAESAGESE